jgi:O-antigen/teichoic acid export membrane protein
MIARAAPQRAALALADQAIVSGSRFVAAVIVGRAAGPVEFGVFAVAVGPLTLLGCVQEALITTPYAVFGSKLRRRAKVAYGGASLAIHGALATVALIAFLFAALIFTSGAGPHHAAWICAMLAVAAPGFLLWEFARRMAFADLQLGRATFIDAAVALVQLAALAALAAAGQLTAASALAAMAVAYYTIGAVWLVTTRRMFILARRNVPKYWRRNWRFGGWLLAGQTVGAIHGMVPQWMLGILSGAALAGTFTACLNLALLANPVIFALANLLTPAAAHALATSGRRELNRLLSRAACSIAGAMLLFAAALAFWGEPLVMLFYGSQYAGNQLAIVLLGLCPVVWAVTTVFACGLTALERNEVNFRAAAIGALTTAAVIGASLNYGVAAGAAGILTGSIVAMLIRAWTLYEAVAENPNPRSKHVLNLGEIEI